LRLLKYFHGAPEDWNCVVAALRSETLPALVAPAIPAMAVHDDVRSWDVEQVRAFLQWCNFPTEVAPEISYHYRKHMFLNVFFAKLKIT
jgi:hypothetical protein